MADMIENINHLATEIGPRPAATEEEQQAALYIAERFQADAGLAAEVEEFSGAISNKKTRAVCVGVAALVTLLSLIFNILTIPALVLTLACAVLLVLEEMGKPMLSNILDKGISQNVVAQYKPAPQPGQSSRRRKIIVVARYDSGAVRPEVNGPLLSALPILSFASCIAVVALPVLMLVKALFFLHATGVAAIIFNVLLVLASLLAILPVISLVMEKASGYNDAANANAAGVAVMLEVARRINNPAGVEEPVIHGPEAVYEAGVVPEGAMLEYDQDALDAAEGVDDALKSSVVVSAPIAAAPVAAVAGAVAAGAAAYEEAGSEAERLLAAKAAIAALTGKKVSEGISLDFSQEAAPAVAPSAYDEPAFVADEEPGYDSYEPYEPGVPAAVAAGVAATFVASEAGSAALMADAAALDAAAQSEPAPEAPTYVPASSSVPDWFAAGRAAARRTVVEEEPSDIHRSRFNTAFDAFESYSAAPVEASAVAPNMDERLQHIQEAAREAKTIQYDRSLVEEPVVAEQQEEAPVELVAEPVVVEAPAVVAEAVAAVDETEEAPAVVEEAAAPAQRETAVVLSSFTDQPLTAPATAEEELEEVTEEAPLEEPAPVAVPMDYFLAAAVETSAISELPTIQAAPAAADPTATVMLPDLGATIAMPTLDAQKQRAPLATAATSGQAAAKGLLTMLPAIDATSAQPDLRSTIPSLSGSLARIPSPTVDVPSLTGSFAPVAGATGTFSPVTTELVQEAVEAEVEEDLVIEDADDSIYEESFTETGAYAGPGYVEMPNKRFGLFDKLFGRKNKKEDVTTNEWLDIDDDFDARSVGAARGGWESFRQDDLEEDDFLEEDTFAPRPFVPKDAEYAAANNYEDEEDDFGFEDDLSWDLEDWDDEEDDFRWNGGAFSNALGSVASAASGAVSRAREAMPGGRKEEEAPRSSRRSRRQEEELVEEPVMDNTPSAVRSMSERKERSSRSEVTRSSLDFMDRLNVEASEPEQDIYNFRASGINTEIWFVALGAETDSHAGIKAFLDEHASELRGAMIVELDALGAGELCLVSKEGVARKASAPSRVRRYLSKATSATGIKPAMAEILWNESAASTAIKQGIQAMHLCGMDGIKPAYYSQPDDVIDVIEEEALLENADFVVELLKNI